MKRLTLLTILLVVVGLTAGFAMDVKPSITLTGTAKVEWGIDLDNMTTGFKNSADLDLTLNLIAADSTDTHAGTGDWYGSIQISNIEAYVAATEVAGGAWTIGALGATAKIVGLGGKLAIGVYGAPDTGSNTDFVAAIENDTNDADDDVFLDDEQPLDVDTSYGLYGTYASYTVSEALTIGLEVVSENDWNLNTNNAYAFALDVLAKFAPITVTAGVNMGIEYAANPIGFGLKVAAAVAPISAWVGFDGQYDTAFAWEVGAGATVTLMETVTAALSVVYGDAFNDLDVKFVFTEPAAKGLVDNLDVTLTAYILDLIGGPLEYKVVLDGGYKVGIVYPNFTVTFFDDTNDETFAIDGQSLTVVVGADVAILPLTTLCAYYTSGNLIATTPVIGDFVVGVKVTY